MSSWSCSPNVVAFKMFLMFRLEDFCSFVIFVRLHHFAVGLTEVRDDIL